MFNTNRACYSGAHNCLKLALAELMTSMAILRNRATCAVGDWNTNRKLHLFSQTQPSACSSDDWVLFAAGDRNDWSAHGSVQP